MRNCLLIVDVQKDLLEIETAASRQQFVANIEALYQGEDWDLVIIGGDKGAKFPPKIRKMADHFVWSGVEPYDEFSLFQSGFMRPKLTFKEILKQAKFEKGDRIVVVGLDRGNRVTQTALDAAASGYLTIVPISGVTWTNPDCLETLRTAGVLVSV